MQFVNTIDRYMIYALEIRGDETISESYRYQKSYVDYIASDAGDLLLFSHKTYSWHFRGEERVPYI